MIARTSGPEGVLALRRRVLADDTPRAIQLPRVNLFGDLRHTLAHVPVLDPGEPFLVRLNRQIRYREVEKFDVIRLPLHYKYQTETARCCFHLQGLKSLTNLLHRFHYFEWRRKVNSGEAREGSESLAEFASTRNRELFGTDEPQAVMFRFNRQLMRVLKRFDAAAHGGYPEVLQEELCKAQRFEVVYRNGRADWRLDKQDARMANYQPTVEDLAWDPQPFLRRFLTPAQMAAIEPAD